MADYRDIAQAVLTLIDGGKSQAAIAGSVAEYLVTERRTRELDRVMREVERLRLVRDGTLEVVATSTRPLTAEAKQTITRLYKEQDVKVITQVDKSLVGGVRLRTLNTQADLSVRGRLHELKNSNT